MWACSNMAYSPSPDATMSGFLWDVGGGGGGGGEGVSSLFCRDREGEEPEASRLGDGAGMLTGL